MSTVLSTEIQIWPIDKLVLYARNPRKNDAAVDRMCGSIFEYGFKLPCLVRSDGEVIDGHLRLKAARKLGIAEIPVILCDEWTPAQVKAFRLLVNRSAAWAEWDEELLKLELRDIKASDYDLALTGFDMAEIDALTEDDAVDEDVAPPVPRNPVSRIGDLWLCGSHRVLCGDATDQEAVARLLGERKPVLLVTDPPYGIELDSEWRDKAGLNKRGAAEPSYLKRRTKGHQETSISGDTRADWSEAFALVPGLEVGYVWPPPSSLAKFSTVCYGSASCTISRSSGTRDERCSPGRTIGSSMNPAGMSGRRMLPGAGKRVKTRRSGIRHRRSSSWEGRMRRNSIIRRRNRSS
jgi:hypothetical protein